MKHAAWFLLATLLAATLFVGAADGDELERKRFRLRKEAAETVVFQLNRTGELTVRYLAPTPIHEPLEFRARVEQVDGRKIDTVADAYTLGPDDQRTHVATATARFIAIEGYGR